MPLKTKFWKSVFWGLLLMSASVCSPSGNAVAARESHACLAAGSNGVIILNISDPEKPVRVGAISVGGSARDVVLAEDYAFVAADVAGLKVIDLRNPAEPALIGTCNTPGSAHAIVVVGKYAYIADYDAGLQIADLTNPAAPTLIGAYDTSGFAVGVTVIGNLAYVADKQEGLQIIDIRNPASTKKLGDYRGAADVLSVAVAGDYAFLAAAGEGLEILDISHRVKPYRLGLYKPPGDAVGVTLVASRLLLTDTSGLHVIDITSKTNLARIGGYQLSGLAGSALVSFNRPAPATAEDIIFDCDPGNDIDDMGDLAVMHALADQGELNILAVMYSMRPGFGAPTIEIANRFYGRPDLPIGVSKTSAWDASDYYGLHLQTNFYHSIGHSSNAPNAVTLYRQILADRPDHSITVVTAGQMRNIYDLWKTPGDSYSPLPGPELLAQKLKRLVIVAGIFPTGHEFNLWADPIAAGVLNSMTNSLPMTFVGIELGNDVLIGKTVLEKPETDPVRAAYKIFYNIWNLDSRPAWAGLGLLFAARGYSTASAPLFTATNGYISVYTGDGSNYWKNDESANQEYLSRIQPASYYISVLDELLMRPPITRGTIHAFLADQSSALHVINITDPANPIRAGGYAFPDKPRLEVIHDGVSATLRWPNQYVGYSVQSAAALEGPWVTLNSGVQETNGYYSFTENALGASRFYRLQKR